MFSTRFIIESGEFGWQVKQILERGIEVFRHNKSIRARYSLIVNLEKLFQKLTSKQNISIKLVVSIFLQHVTFLSYKNEFD